MLSSLEKMIGVYLPLPQSQMNTLRLAFLKRLVFQYEPDLQLFQSQTRPLPPDEINQLGLCFENVDRSLRIRESEIEIYVNALDPPVRFVIQEAPDQHECLCWTIFPSQ